VWGSRCGLARSCVFCEVMVFLVFMDSPLEDPREGVLLFDLSEAPEAWEPDSRGWGPFLKVVFVPPCWRFRIGASFDSSAKRDVEPDRRSKKRKN
jgi:hypothetical protein